jgi:hypothetical protein
MFPRRMSKGTGPVTVGLNGMLKITNIIKAEKYLYAWCYSKCIRGISA